MQAAPTRSMLTPMGAHEDRFSVVVAGDDTFNWNLAPAEKVGSTAARASIQRGGAGLLRELVAQSADRSPDGLRGVDVHVPELPPVAPPSDPRFHHRFAVWSRYAKTKDKKAKDAQEKVWRVERFLGTQRAEPGLGQPPPQAGPEEADLVVLHDAGLGFRDREDLWPRAIRDGAMPRWVLLRTVKPVTEGALWERLQPFADRTIVVIRIDDLRLGGMHVTRELSWERTAQDLLSELCNDERLMGCAHVVVSFTTAGALVLSGKGGAEGEPSCRLVFDPAVMERMWNEAHDGDMIGGVTALTAGIAREVTLNPDAPDVIWGARCGIAAMRKLDRDGYAEGASADGAAPGIVYPKESMARELSSPKPPAEERHLPTEAQPFAEAPICKPRHDRFWTILEERHPEDRLEDLAFRIVTEGYEEALQEIPRGEFGDLVTFDRTEIEGLQSIRSLIRQYEGRSRPSRPLSIAVFGPPGAGKTWSVKQVAKGVLDEDVPAKTFNLSQFDDPQGLIDAFYQIRDISLGGKLPLILWDEFDGKRVTAGGEQEFGWLSHFLSPMEDGVFQHGQLSHPIGRAVFVFAGGRYKRMEEFREAADKAPAAKAPDFVSRLRGYVDVVGPDPREKDPEADPYYVIRRAVMVRQLLRRHWREIFKKEGGVERADIDEAVLRALLRTSRYRHGTRSLDSIIATSVVRGQDRFGRSDLPSEALLDLHVEASDFLRVLRGGTSGETGPAAPRPAPEAAGSG